MSLIIHAPNVHQGGGRTLLSALLTALRHYPNSKAILDTRLLLPQDFPPSMVLLRVRPSLFGRLAAEWRLRWIADEKDTVLCFGNLPPLFKVHAKVFLFVQNMYLVGNCSLSGFSLRVQLRIFLERFWLRAKLSNRHCILVQTPTMQRALMKGLGLRAEVLSFLPHDNSVTAIATHSERRERRFDFLYVSSGEPHKNHLRLIAAWILLAKENIRPRLALTLCPVSDAELCRYVEQAAAIHGADITNIGVLPVAQLKNLYEETNAFIYPSLLESFGLPLLEAAAARLPIVAPELDYVRDLLDPAQTFDPESPISIARAVRRHLGLPETKTMPICAKAFLKTMLAKSA